MQKRLVMILMYLLVVNYGVLYHYQHQTDFQRYPNFFAAGTEFYKKDYLPREYGLITPFPNFSPKDSLPTEILDAGYMVYTHPTLAEMVIELSLITGLNSREIILIPLGSFIMPLIFYVVIKGFVKKGEHILQYLLYLYYIIYYLDHESFRVIYVAVSTYTLFYILLLLVKWNLSNERDIPKPKNAFISLLLLISFPLLWHSMSFIVMYLLVGILLSATLFAIAESSINSFFIKNIIPKIFYLTLFSLIAIFTFSRIMFGSGYISRLIGTLSLEYFHDLLIQQRLEGKFSNPYIYYYAKESLLGRIFFYSHTTLLFLNTGLILMAIAFFVIKYRRQKIHNKTTIILVSMAIGGVIAQITFSITYSLAAVGLVYVLLVFPLFSVSALSYLELSKKLKFAVYIVLFILIILAGLCTVIRYETHELGALSLTRYEDIIPSSKWIEYHVQPSTQFYTDFNLFGKYLQWEADNEILIFELYSLNSINYAQIMRGKLNANLILDCKTMAKGFPIHPRGGRYLLISELETIQSSTNFHKIYQDNAICTFISI